MTTIENHQNGYLLSCEFCNETHIINTQADGIAIWEFCAITKAFDERHSDCEPE